MKLFYLIYILLINVVNAEVIFNHEKHLTLIESQTWKLNTQNASYKLQEQVLEDESLLFDQFAWNKRAFEIDLTSIYRNLENKFNHPQLSYQINLSKQKIQLKKDFSLLFSVQIDIQEKFLKLNDSQTLHCEGTWQKKDRGLFQINPILCNIENANKVLPSLLKIQSKDLKKSALNILLTPILQSKQCKKIASFYLFDCTNIKQDITKDAKYDVQILQKQSSYFADHYTLQITKKKNSISYDLLESFLQESMNSALLEDQQVSTELQNELLKSRKLNLYMSLHNIDKQQIDKLSKYASHLINQHFENAMIHTILNNKDDYIKYIESQQLQSMPETISSVHQDLTISIKISELDGKLYYEQSFFKNKVHQRNFGYLQKKNSTKMPSKTSLILLTFILACFSILI